MKKFFKICRIGLILSFMCFMLPGNLKFFRFKHFENVCESKNIEIDYREQSEDEQPALKKQESKQLEVAEKTDLVQDAPEKKAFIKWVDFNASARIISKAYDADLSLKKIGENDIGICEILAYLALKNGNKFNFNSDNIALNKLMLSLKNGDKSVIEKYSENKYYKYYAESFHAIFDGIVGEHTTADGEKKYGLKGYFPLANGFWNTGYDDFGNSRGYGFKRRHLGHDMFGGVGTPIIAVEGGTITELGWNQYGGWRVGIRSDDTKRYYYYAHLRKNRPFAANLKKGDRVEAGQVIGYLGVTGYSRKENVNMTTTKPHLHFGLQLIFDESQEDGKGEIWIDVYALTKFLNRNKMSVVKNAETGEYESKARQDT